MRWSAVLGGLMLLACGGRASQDAVSGSGGSSGSSPDDTGTAPGSGGAPVTSGCVAEVSAGGVAVCAIRQDGALFCWGNNARGQAGSKTERIAHVTHVEEVGAVVAVGRGSEFTCALDREHQVWCWGGNNFGQLGIGSLNFDSPTPQRALPVPGQVVALSPGGTHMCVRTAAGEAWCWGNNGWGELGLGYTSRDVQGMPAPRRVEALQGVRLLAAAEVQTCAADDTTTWCWGGRDDNAGSGVPEPTVIDWGGVAGELAMSGTQSCAVDNERVSCWNGNFQVHPERYEFEGIAEQVSGLAVGPRHACGIGTLGRLLCWGDNDLAQLGRVTTEAEDNPPAEVARPGRFSRVSVGDNYTCAIDYDAVLWCWGDNTFGQIQFVEASHDNVVTEPARIDIPCD